MESERPLTPPSCEKLKSHGRLWRMRHQPCGREAPERPRGSGGRCRHRVRDPSRRGSPRGPGDPGLALLWLRLHKSLHARLAPLWPVKPQKREGRDIVT